jgi:hypothetical protein
MTNNRIVLHYKGERYAAEATGEAFDVGKGVYCCFTKMLIDGVSIDINHSRIINLIEDLRELYDNRETGIKKELLEKGFCVNTRTYEQYDELMNWLEDNTDIKWTSNESPQIGENYNLYGKDTVINLMYHRIMFASAYYHNINTQEFLNYEDIWG